MAHRVRAKCIDITTMKTRDHTKRNYAGQYDTPLIYIVLQLAAHAVEAVQQS